MDKETISWEDHIKTYFYGPSSTIAIEELYQAFKERLYQEWFSTEAMLSTVDTTLTLSEDQQPDKE